MSSIEPYEATTVSRRPLMPQGNRTLADYQASIIARFGKLPSFDVLAKKESNRAMLRDARHKAEGKQDEGLRNVYRVAALKRGVKKLMESEAVVMGALTGPTSITAMRRTTGRSHDSILSAMLRLEERGLVARTGIGKQRLWHRVQEAVLS